MSSKRSLEDGDFSGDEGDERVEKKAKTSTSDSKTTKAKAIKGSGDIVFELGMTLTSYLWFIFNSV